jgi:hypothetical protein
MGGCAGAVSKRVQWETPFETVKKVDLKEASVEWFIGGKLNVSGEWHSRSTVRSRSLPASPMCSHTRALEHLRVFCQPLVL